MKHQFELPSAGLGGVFNLSGERADDPFRLEREHWEAQERIRTRLDYAAKMQLQLKDCPGFCSCDAPSSEDEKGRVVVEPGRIVEATQWLKRRLTSRKIWSCHLTTDWPLISSRGNVFPVAKPGARE